MTQKLSQILAIEKAKKTTGENAFTAIYHQIEKRELFQGLARNYKRKVDGTEDLPPERKHVQARVADQFEKVREILADLFDLAGAKDNTNCIAKADVILNGEIVLKAVPATHLLWLEKKLEDILTFVRKLPALDPGFEWKKDPAQGLWRTDPIETIRTKKEPRVITLAPATDKHPANVQLLQEDVPVGTWETIHLSGALPAAEIEALVKRVQNVKTAVTDARERANMVVAERLESSKLLDYIFPRGKQ